MCLTLLKAHQQCRKADRLLAAGKYEEAISCHGKAAGELCDTYDTVDYTSHRVSLTRPHVKAVSVLFLKGKSDSVGEVIWLGTVSSKERDNTTTS